MIGPRRYKLWANEISQYVRNTELQQPPTCLPIRKHLSIVAQEVAAGHSNLHTWVMTTYELSKLLGIIITTCKLLNCADECVIIT